MKSFILPLLILAVVANVSAQPVITTFTPASGPIGTTVTISGTGFSASPTANSVYFGGVKATVLSASVNSLTVTVPPGATYKPLSVTTANLTASSAGSFDVTFPGGGIPLVPLSFVPAGGVFSNMGSRVSAMADFNEDGKMDIFSVQGFSQGIEVYINTTVGHTVSFGQSLALNTISTGQNAAAAADLDGDGKPDIIIANDGQVYSISVYRNTSSGSTVSFGANQDYPANNFPGSIAVGDLDGDGRPDLAVADGPGQVISLFRNTSTPGNISFAARVDISPGSTPVSLAINDLDGDGKADLALSTATGLGTIKNLSVQGSFSFGSLVICAPVTGLVSVRTGDLDGDGKPDLVAANFSGSNLVASKNNSTPGTITFASAQSFPCFTNTNCVNIEDIDGDGRPDLVSSNVGFVNVSIFRNTGAPGSFSFAAAQDYNIGNTSLAFSATADLDANGRPDIIAGSSGFLVDANMVGAAPPTITSYSPTAGITGTVITITGTHFTGTTSVQFGGVAASSFTVNSDTQITAIVGGSASGNLTVTNADATATALLSFTFLPPVITDFYPAIGGPGTVVKIKGTNFANITTVKFGFTAAASFTVDSATGITAIVGDGGTGDVTVASPNGTTSLSSFSYNPPVITSFSPASGEVTSIVTITGQNFYPDTTYDIVRFGAVKAVIISASATELKVKVPPGASYQPLSVTTNGRTAYASKPFVVTFPSDNSLITTNSFATAGTYTTGPAPTDLGVADMDGDGRADVITLNRQANTMSFFFNNSTIGNIRMAQRIDFNADPYPLRIVLSDINADGRPDVVLLNDGPIMGTSNPSRVAVLSNYMNPGGGGFGGVFSMFTTNGTQGLCVADMNGDALPDIVVSNGSTGTITVYPNTTWYGGSTISFGQKIDYTNMGHPDKLISTDVDNDGRPDLIAVDVNGNTFTVYRNISAGGKFALAPGTAYPKDPAFANSTSTTFADWNGDGKVDLGFGRSSSGLISLWQNNGTGTPPFTPVIDIPVSHSDTWFFNGDLDGDSKPDLIALSPGENSLSILRNTIGDPVITSLSADTAYKGTLIRITGRNFTNTVNVSFGGVTADSFHVVSPTEIDAVVGPGASGNVSVTTLYGIGSFAGFIFIPQIVPEGDTIFCRGKYVKLRSTAASGNLWYKDGIVVSGDTVIRADSAGSYVVSTTSNGFTTSSQTQKVIVKNIPAPTITKDADGDLVSSVLTGNQWYFDVYQQLDTNQIHRPGPAGTYQVTTTRDGCTSDPSLPYYWGGIGSIELPDDQFIRYYPNPVTNTLYIAQHVNGQPLMLDLSFMDGQGRLLLAIHNTSEAVVNVSSLPVGILYLRIICNGTYKVDKTVRILKMR